MASIDSVIATVATVVAMTSVAAFKCYCYHQCRIGLARIIMNVFAAASSCSSPCAVVVAVQFLLLLELSLSLSWLPSLPLLPLFVLCPFVVIATAVLRSLVFWLSPVS